MQTSPAPAHHQREVAAAIRPARLHPSRQAAHRGCQQVGLQRAGLLQGQEEIQKETQDAVKRIKPPKTREEERTRRGEEGRGDDQICKQHNFFL